ncbi:malto-oligosyltrehalose synthase [Leifsonia sp. NPDC102414]|uniref:malto-oligosyltrehalose synthase n=1 Tax=Leifsonia sp. NPDC102414 TaxID=3364124 RepID=UPI003819BB06
MAVVSTSSYRLQISPDFTLRDAAQILGYLRRLGVGWVYLSPLLEAEPGSAHGYDVVDHSRVDAARGGPDALLAFSDAAHRRGLRVLVDIVPNHMGIATPALNAWWWDVLGNGQESPFADHFDIDWAAGGGRVRIPVLGHDDDTAELSVEDGELRYYEHRFPIAAGTEGGTPAEVHDRQHYELVSWRRADHDLNYRRFFAVNTLAGIRVEDDRVFDASHAEIGRWMREGLVDGLRVDHPDGLAHPGRYLERLAALAEGRPVWVEKILEGDERIPDWPVSGTTGYDALALIDRVFVDPAGADTLTELAGDAETNWAALVHDRKRAVADGILNSEVRRIARLLDDAETGAQDATIDAVAELAACFPVYRSYLPFGIDQLHAARDAVLASRPDLADALARVVQRLADPADPAAVRFQQTSGMIMAKGVEDNAFYRYTRLISLTEVGAEPAEFAVPVAEFHERQLDRQERLPESMTTLSTHDTKRGEDTRARVSALAELPDAWARFLREVAARASIGDASLEDGLWQAAVGAWPISRERLREYALKAAREAGTGTSWTDGDQEFEQRLLSLVDAAYDDDIVRGEVEAISARVDAAGASNSLGAKLVQLLSPGMPDVYQGSERWEQSLVDPDNRRPVGFDAADALLARIDDGWLPDIDSSGAVKVLVTSRALRLRRDRPELFTTYRPLVATGAQADHAIAFDRGGAIAIATRLPIGLAAAGGWQDTTIDLGGQRMRDELTGAEHTGTTRLATILEHYPVALLVVL